MNNHYFPHQAINGMWHAVYRLAGCDTLASVAESASQELIVRECRRLNRERQAELDAVPA